MSGYEGYISGVMGGAIPSCHWARRAVERHLDDLENGDGRGLVFDEEAAAHAISFFAFLRHSKGEWAGSPLVLEGWQQFIQAMLFGWMKVGKDGGLLRRFRVAYIEVPRKNGKTTMAAGDGLYLFDADGEPGAEVYTAATKRDQARIAHAEATRMVKASPFLRRHIQVFRDNLSIPARACKFEPLGRDADSMDGLNVHGAIIDELHAHKNREVYDVLDTATGSRRQPLIMSITTAGFDRHSVCFGLHDYTQKVLDRVVEDDSHFGIIYSIDEGDDWADEQTWAKANPNLGVSVKIEDLRRKAVKAKAMPSALNAFQRLHLNVWTQAESRWMSPDAWGACGLPVPEDGLRGRTCYMGLDLSSTTDISALVLVFPPEGADDPFSVVCRFWIPEESMRERSNRDRVPYDVWVRQGYMMATPGNVIDYDFILAEIDDLAQRYDIGELAFDRWGATKLIQDIQEQGQTVVQFGQGFASMSGPMKELEKLVLSKKIAHGNNPVLTWMANNLVATQDPAGNVKPDKARSTEKIDGMVALIMGLDRAIRKEGSGRSVYEERGLIEL